MIGLGHEILIVNDDTSVWGSLEALLNAEGCRPRCFGAGGDVFLRVLTMRKPLAPVIVLTTCRGPILVENVRATGAERFLYTPAP